jgi:hypothetical protein
LPRVSNSPGAVVASEQTRRIALEDFAERPARLRPCYD